jgi:hypothetical protein
MVWLAGFRGKVPFRGVFLRGVLGGLWEVGFGGGGRGGGGGYLNNTLLANICASDIWGPLGGDCRK